MEPEELKSAGSRSQKPDGRFNEWGERKWLTASPEKQRSVATELAGLGLSPRARDLYTSARLTDSSGVEFVFVSNAQFGTVILEGIGLQIVPCFIPLDPLRPRTEERQAAMMKRGQFIYDGWLPSDKWTPARLEALVSFLDDIVSLFSMVGGYHAYWEPKYHYSAAAVASQIALPRDLHALVDSLNVMDGLSQADRTAVSRSLGWLSHALRSSPVQRFLLLFVSIEGLASYIERESEADSPLRRFSEERLTKQERKEKREACIRETMTKGLEPTQAVQEAYFTCVTGNKAMLMAHLTRVLHSERVGQVMFADKVAGKTLWELRNDIAHGDLNVLSDDDVWVLSQRLGELEAIAREYLRSIFIALAGSDYFTAVRRPVLVFPASLSIGGPGTEYQGPTDMAEYYTNVQALSASYVKVRFQDQAGS
jgi:hypothetical protein